MIPFRTQVKFFLDTTNPIDGALFTGVFQRWIRDNTLDELLIDVADYRHVFQGPGTVLIGHYSDYTLDNRDGRLGLLYTRKRQTSEDVAAQLRTSLQRNLQAAELLEGEAAFQPALKFNLNEIEVRFVDRLNFQNNSATFDSIKDDVSAVLSAFYGDHTLQVEQVQGDPRDLFALKVWTEGAVSLADLKEQVQSV
ncbi:MAG: hypothetical protein GC179_06970 [Anaerolineaceae bacterium]|nr:hypothetical protein [Anaerolineaceae bacterium]